MFYSLTLDKHFEFMRSYLWEWAVIIRARPGDEKKDLLGKQAQSPALHHLSQQVALQTHATVEPGEWEDELNYSYDVIVTLFFINTEIIIIFRLKIWSV